MTRSILLVFILGLVVGRMFSTPTDERTVQISARPVVAKIGEYKSEITSGTLKPDSLLPQNNVELKRKNHLLSHELSAMKEAFFQRLNPSDCVTTAASNYSEFDQEIVISTDLLVDMEEEEEQISLESQQQNEHYIDMLEQRFAGEMLNSTWSAEITKEIQTALESLYVEVPLDFTFESLDCRTSMCRLKVEFNEWDEQHEFESRILGAVGSMLPKFSARQEREGDSPGIVYFFQSNEPNSV